MLAWPYFECLATRPVLDRSQSAATGRRKFRERHLLSRCLACASIMTMQAGAEAAPRRDVEVGAEPTRVNRAQPIGAADPGLRRMRRRGRGAKPAEPTDARPPAAAASDGKFSLGGAIRLRAVYLFDATDRRTRLPSTASFSGFDVAQVRVKYDSSTLFGAAQYSIFGGTYPYDRPNGYENYFGEMSFLKFAYVGYNLNAADSIAIGLQQIPFGIVPYFGVSFLETMGYVVGMEDAFNVGIKYSHVEPDLNYQLAYFPADGGNYFGISTDSARYTANIVRADPSLRDGTNNVEQHALVGRIERTFFRNETSSVTLGASVLRSSVYNYDTGLYGSRQQAALHVVGTHEAWTARAVAARLDIDPRNPGGQNALITMGSYDAPFNVATRGFLVSAEVSHKLALDNGPFAGMTPYFHYSAYFKDRAEFFNSERIMVGSIFKSRNLEGLIVYSEFRVGRNDIYVGSGNYSQGAGAGGTNEWAASWFTNIGYYF